MKDGVFDLDALRAMTCPPDSDEEDEEDAEEVAENFQVVIKQISENLELSKICQKGPKNDPWPDSNRRNFHRPKGIRRANRQGIYRIIQKGLFKNSNLLKLDKLVFTN